MSSQTSKRARTGRGEAQFRLEPTTAAGPVTRGSSSARLVFYNEPDATNSKHRRQQAIHAMAPCANTAAPSLPVNPHSSSQVDSGVTDLNRGSTGNTAQSSLQATLGASLERLGMYGFTADELVTAAELNEFNIGFPSHETQRSDAAVPDESLAYWYALRETGSAFRLDTSVFILQDWDPKKGLLKVRYVMTF